MGDNSYIRFDWFMKHMLRDKSNFEILEGFISVLLGEDVKIEEILESEGNQESDDDKFNRVDIKAKNSKGHLIIVEVQLTRQLYYLQRIVFYIVNTVRVTITCIMARHGSRVFIRAQIFWSIPRRMA